MLQTDDKGEAVVGIMRRLRRDFLAEANGALVGAVCSGKVSGRMAGFEKRKLRKSSTSDNSSVRGADADCWASLNPPGDFGTWGMSRRKNVFQSLVCVSIFLSNIEEKILRVAKMIGNELRNRRTRDWKACGTNL